MVKKTDIIKAIEDGRLYDFVACEYYQMDKSTLVDLCKELAYAIYSVNNNDVDAELLENLSDVWEDELTEESEEENEN